MARPATPMYTPGPSFELLSDGALSINDAGVFAGDLCREEIKRAINRGEIATFHHGRRVLIPRKIVVQWLADKWRREHGTGDAKAGEPNGPTLKKGKGKK